MKMIKQLALLPVILILSSCTWVKVTEAGESVQVLATTAAPACKGVGKVTAISRAKVAGIKRSYKKLALELETIARNEAPGMGGNAVAPVSEIEGNEQVFRVYQCD